MLQQVPPATRRSEVTPVRSFRLLIGLCFAAATATVAGVVVLAALTSWWVLFALFGVPPLVMLVCGAAMMATGGSLARSCADMPCASWPRGDVAWATQDR